MSFLAFLPLAPNSQVVSYVANNAYDAYFIPTGGAFNGFPLKVLGVKVDNTTKTFKTINDADYLTFDSNSGIFYSSQELLTSNEADIPAEATHKFISAPSVDAMESLFSGKRILIRNSLGVFHVTEMVVNDDNDPDITYKTASNTYSNEREDGDRLYIEME